MAAPASSIVFGSSPNWYCSAASDVRCPDDGGTATATAAPLCAYGSQAAVALLRLCAPTPRFAGLLVGHKRQSRVTAVSFSPHRGLGHVCVSGATDCTLRVCKCSSALGSRPPARCGPAPVPLPRSPDLAGSAALAELFWLCRSVLA